MKKSATLCLVCSSGGHLLKTHQLSAWWRKKPHFWVTEENFLATSLLNGEKVYFGKFPVQRNFLNFFKNLFLAFQVLRKEKPDYVFSTGAGIAPPFFIAAKILKCKTIFIETFIFIPQPTLSGKLVYFLSDYFFVQNRKLQKIYPKAKYLGPIL